MYLLITVIITELSSSFGWKWKQWKPLRTSLFGRFYWIKLLKPPRERISCMAFHCGPPVSLKEANGSLEALITSSWEPLQRQVRAFSTSIGINLKKVSQGFDGFSLHNVFLHHYRFVLNGRDVEKLRKCSPCGFSKRHFG